MTTEPASRPRGTTVERVERVLIGTLIALLVGILLLGAGWWALFVRAEEDVAPGRSVQVEIESGSSTAEIARKLADVGVVPNANMFRLYVRIEGVENELKAGVYDLATGMTNEDAADVLVEGPSVIYRSVTIPEGFVVEQVAERFEAEAGVSAEDFLALAKGGASEFRGEHPYVSDVYGGSLEGYLFPKTYRVREGSSASGVIEMMLDQFEAETADLDLGYPRSKGLSLHDTVTIASMIEREVKIAKERPLVASVIYNRLAADMFLEIDATIEYVLPGNRFRLRSSDLKLDSPYNTYRNKGLPPGPIASPGLAALEAACAPAQSDYLYYVLTAKDGSHTFAVTREEFLKAKQRSKEVFGQ